MLSRTCTLSNASQNTRSEGHSYPRSDGHYPPFGSRSMTFPDEAFFDDSEDSEQEARCGRAFVMHKSNPFRTFWFILITALLAYTGTIFLYRLCFIQFRIDMPYGEPPEELQWEGPDPESDSQWAAFDTFVTVVFWVDLVANFFFSYDNQDGKEIDDLRAIASNYLSTHFTINLIACIPEQVVQMMIEGVSGKVPPNQGVRALRLQRISRLARLMRLTRLAKLRAHRKSPVFQWFEKQKGIRLVNLGFGLAWCVHILACGWYLCASLHDNPADTWVYRRTADGESNISLAWRPPVDQWVHSMYFVLTVFSTVGFGDISAMTLGEISYTCVTMAVGAVVHSIIISEVINVVTSSDLKNEAMIKRREQIEAFALHTQMTEQAEDSLIAWVECSGRSLVSSRLDPEEMKSMILGSTIPRALLGRLPSALYQGRLIRNRFLAVCSNCATPPRLPMLLALAAKRCIFTGGEVVYQAQDYPVNLFLVLEGTFAYVARPDRKRGGQTYLPRVRGFEPHITSPKSVTNIADIVKSFRVSSVPHEPAAKVAQQDSLRDDDDQEEALYPFMLFGAGSYFGDVELLRSLPRRATARCESETGVVLSLSKADFKDLSTEFPQFAAEWAKGGVARDRQRIWKQSQLVRGLNYRCLAARAIQQRYRQYKNPSLERRTPFGYAPQKKLVVDVIRRLCYANEGLMSDEVAMLHDSHQAMFRDLRQELAVVSNTVADMSRRIDQLVRAAGWADESGGRLTL